MGQSGPLPSILAGPTEKQQERVVSDTRLERHMLKPDRPDLRPERYDGGRGTNKHLDRQKKVLCSKGIRPSWGCCQKKATMVLVKKKRKMVKKKEKSKKERKNKRK